MAKYGVLLVFIMLLSCNEKVVEKPENLIPEEKMISVLYDMAVINAAKNMNQDILLEYDIEPMAYIYSKHGVDSLQFVKSDLYYASNPSEYETIYTAVKDKLEKDEQYMEEHKKKMDSIKAAKERERLGLDKKKKAVKDSLP
ncbi:MAG: DUF4296 domain-containing protein [Arenibacter sp.]|nr:DUF4296 domain-containing protein [Arenibacter sp.]